MTSRSEQLRELASLLRSAVSSAMKHGDLERCADDVHAVVVKLEVLATHERRREREERR